jgi:hypothetical protein
MKFVVKKAGNGEFRFDLVASNGQIVATSETYKQKSRRWTRSRRSRRTPAAPHRRPDRRGSRGIMDDAAGPATTANPTTSKHSQTSPAPCSATADPTNATIWDES